MLIIGVVSSSMINCYCGGTFIDELLMLFSHVFPSILIDLKIVEMCQCVGTTVFVGFVTHNIFFAVLCIWALRNLVEGDYVDIYTIDKKRNNSLRIGKLHRGEIESYSFINKYIYLQNTLRPKCI